MKVAACQAPLMPEGGINAAIRRIQQDVAWCEAEGVSILCCPEGVLGGLADYAADPRSIAIALNRLADLLAPLASDTVTTIVGFTEIDRAGRLFNTAAVFHRGSITGVYRKLHPAINGSVYTAGEDRPIFTIDGFTFGIIICRDSTFAEPLCSMAAKGASAIFVPTNNGLPPAHAHSALADEARACDRARAIENGVAVIRADVSGRTEALVSYGSSGIVAADGTVLQLAPPFTTGVLVADIEHHA